MKFIPCALSTARFIFLSYVTMAIATTLFPISNAPRISMLHAADVSLASSIVIETISTCLLGHTNSNKLFFVPVYAGYAFSFYMFPKCLSKYSLSVAYAIWSCMGIILTCIFDSVFSNVVFSQKKIFGIALLIAGMCFVK